MTESLTTAQGYSRPTAGLSPRSPSRYRLVRWVLLGLGSVLVGIGVAGIFLPLLPSTVFFLMAAGCYGKASPRAYRWLTTNRWFGRHLRDYKEDHCATISAKLTSIASLWLGIGLSFWLVDNVWIRLALIVIALGVSAHLLRLKRAGAGQRSSAAG